MMVTLREAALKRISISLLETDLQPKATLTMPLSMQANPIFVSVLFSTEVNLASAIYSHLTKVFLAHLTDPQYVQVVPIHFVNQLSNFSKIPFGF